LPGRGGASGLLGSTGGGTARRGAAVGGGRRGWSPGAREGEVWIEGSSTSSIRLTPCFILYMTAWLFLDYLVFPSCGL
jgi:hypothetical protein